MQRMLLRAAGKWVFARLQTLPPPRPPPGRRADQRQVTRAGPERRRPGCDTRPDTIVLLLHTEVPLAARPHDVADLYLSPVVLAVDARIEELGDFAASPDLDVLARGIEHGVSELLAAARKRSQGDS